MKNTIVRIQKDVRIAPRLVSPTLKIEEFIPTRVGLKYRIRVMFRPMHEVIGDCQTDALNETAIRVTDPGVEHVPTAIVFNDTACPRSEVIPASARAGKNCIFKHLPFATVL